MSEVSAFHAYLQTRAAPPPNPMAEEAIALGVPCFPCGASKAPLTAHGHKDATRDPVALRRMFADPAAVLIGVPTGRASGWVAIDVDVKEGARGQEWLDSVTDRLPSTRTHATRSGGWHLIFKAPETVELRNSASRIAPGVDVRGEGGFIIVAGPGYHIFPGNPEPAEMPDWLLSAALPPVVQPAAPSQPRAAPRPIEHGGSRYGLAALESACQEIRSAGNGTKHATLNRAAYSIGGLVTAGEVQDGEAFAALSAALADIRTDCKDYRAAERTLRDAYQSGKGKPRDVPERIPVTVPDEYLASIQPFLDKIHTKAAKAVAKPMPVTPELMDVGGVLGMFVEHCEATAMSSQPFLALAAGICLIGALAGRKYRTVTDLRTNIYAIGVADSGGGKDHARKVTKQVLAAAHLTQYLGGEDLASGAAVYTALQRHPAMLFQIDEFGDWLAEVLGPKAATHKKQIAQRLKTLYSSASSFLSGTEYADQTAKGRPREDIQQPHACLYGTTTPGQLWAAIAGGSLHDGLMARMLLFVSPCSYPDEAEPSDKPIPKALIAGLQAIAAGPGAAVPQGGGNLPHPVVASMPSDATPEPLCVRQTAAADEAWRSLRKSQLAAQRAAEGTYVTAIAGRLAENAIKLALVRAVSRNPAAPVIDAADVAWGRALAQHCIDTLLREADRNVADSDFERKMNKTIGIIRQNGPITESQMMRKGFKYPPKEAKDILGALVASGMVVATTYGGGPGQGHPTVRYSLSCIATEPSVAELSD